MRQLRRADSTPKSSSSILPSSNRQLFQLVRSIISQLPLQIKRGGIQKVTKKKKLQLATAEEISAECRRSSSFIRSGWHFKVRTALPGRHHDFAFLPIGLARVTLNTAAHGSWPLGADTWLMSP